MEPVLAELDEARRVLEAQGLTLSASLLGGSSPGFEPLESAKRLGLELDVVDIGNHNLPGALLDGFRAALADGADVVVSLDADGQHDPRQIPDLVRSHISRGSGLTIGSRWTRGGSSPGTGAVRSVLSRLGNAAVKGFTGARGVSDSTTAFRVYHPDVVEVLLRETLPSQTYGFFSAMVAVVQAQGFQVDEVPIVFRPRHAGTAPVTVADLREFASSLPSIRRHVHAVRRDMRHDQAQWALRNPRLRAQATTGNSLFGATEELASLAEADRFLSWICDTIEPHLGHRVLEVGAGVGAIATKLAAAGHEVTAIEPADNVFPELERRTSGLPGLTVDQVTSNELLSRTTSRFDSVVYVSVLEHIRDHVAELRTAAELVVPGGTVAIFVPAMPSLYGSLDFKSGHYRRYDRALLTSAIISAGLDPVEVRYMDLLGVVPYFVMYRMLSVSTLGGGSSAFYDRVIVPVSRRFERFVGRPGAGKNLVAVARRPLRSSPSA